MTTRPSPHVGFPQRLDVHGGTALVDDEAYLRGLVEQVLFTRPGERVNRPDFGSGVGAMVFAPIDDEVARATQGLVHGALQRLLGDLIHVEQVEVSAEDSTLRVLVAYRPLRSPDTDPRRVLEVSSGGAP
ncbi:GPW/gp25 family protein [Cellulomonas sp. ICMP 17802]|uniref:GPW/gp25 family protein n=1 Tax=Cellulomonas sp. ICMP 17802 TaxID=3239199 RepID=UPI00351AEAC3